MPAARPAGSPAAPSCSSDPPHGRNRRERRSRRVTVRHRQETPAFPPPCHLAASSDPPLHTDAGILAAAPCLAIELAGRLTHTPSQALRHSIRSAATGPQGRL